MTGELWMRVPQVVQVRIDGQPGAGVYPKDVILHVLGKIKADGAVYKAIDFTGSMWKPGCERTNGALQHAVEMGAKTAYMQPNQAVHGLCDAAGGASLEVVETDADFEYAQTFVFDVSDLSPQIAKPHSVDNVSPIDDVLGVKVHQGFVGACTADERTISPGMGNSARQKDPPVCGADCDPRLGAGHAACLDKGYIQDLMEAGATISSPAAGRACRRTRACWLRARSALPLPTAISPPHGQQGRTDLLASPATVAASVLKGCITDPRTL
jgi:3-isopropylmalate/(R)-2-methylmalate dehydratase large subunit